MNKFVAAFFMVFAVGFLSVGVSSAAQAYGDPTETVQDAPQVVSQSDAQGAAAASSTSDPLPSTGGPDGLLLVGGAALLLVGGASVVVARRRPTS